MVHEAIPVFDADDLAAVWLTLRLASVTTALLLLTATPLAWWLTHAKGRLAALAGPLLTLPVVLPPSVLGFYLLVALGADGPLGRLTLHLGLGVLPFTFAGLVVASWVYSLPFAVQPLQTAFASLGERPVEVAATLRAGPLDRFFSVVMPLSRHGFFNAAVLGFAHTVGEFGVVLMIGGNIPGKTQVLSLRIYQHVEAMEYGRAWWLAGGMLIFSFLTLLLVQRLGRRPPA